MHRRRVKIALKGPDARQEGSCLFFCSRLGGRLITGVFFASRFDDQAFGPIRAFQDPNLDQRQLLRRQRATFGDRWHHRVLVVGDQEVGPQRTCVNVVSIVDVTQRILGVINLKVPFGVVDVVTLEASLLENRQNVTFKIHHTTFVINGRTLAMCSGREAWRQAQQHAQQREAGWHQVETVKWQLHEVFSPRHPRKRSKQCRSNSIMIGIDLNP